ncbi:MAG TPA: PspC domain-containing protein [Pseudomonadales bacterium]|nr:hypothetical protein [Gammaproteobacteria bacterium]MDP6027447.1 PspC domain-containing protein [Pseudomonadales bacterium]MDP6315358.1 PspC domain-containing protein [Pseudomonadales bacterium]MDP7315413.1 PspC domain-containing protein [Pseudomonadales bacterium]HJP49911.1 PspC domain-containing protein [Pseudomonadales bacterium]
MSRSDRERRDAERAARRANRLADRAEQRAQRKGEHSRRAAERAEDLAERAHRRRSPRDREIDRSIEDYVDDVAEKWSRKAEDWIGEQSRKLFEEGESISDGRRSAETEAKKARREAEAAREAAMEATADAIEEVKSRTHKAKRRSHRNKFRKNRRKQNYDARLEFDFGHWRRRKRRRTGYGLYRDSRNKKICGVCAGTAEYLGVETWQVRLGAVLGLIFVPQVAVPTYFITYFLMDKKPYYREAADRFDERHEADEEVRPMRKRKSEYRANEPEVSNLYALKTARHKFQDIEDRLRLMETHVTSSQFELEREIKKISGDD